MTTPASSLREKALAAWRAEEAQYAALRADANRRAEAAEQERKAQEMVLVKKSQLHNWFPDQKWDHVGRVNTGVVVHAVGTDLVFVVVASGTADHFVYVCRVGVGRDWLVGATRVRTLADVGRVIHLRESARRPAVGE